MRGTYREHWRIRFLHMSVTNNRYTCSVALKMALVGSFQITLEVN